MENKRTHYEYLKVTRDAPIEVIRAAYRSLSQKYHPDRNSGSETATQMMKLLNVAYETLTDLAKRQQYDAWIGSGEDDSRSRDCMSGEQTSAPEVVPARQGFLQRWRWHLVKYGYWYVLAFLCIWIVINTIAEQPSTASPRYQASPMIFETSLTSPSLLKLAEAGKPRPNSLTAKLSVWRPHYDVNLSTASADTGAIAGIPIKDERAGAVAARYDMSQVLKDL